MFGIKKERGEAVSGTVERFGVFLDGGGAFLTYEIRLKGHPQPFCIGTPPRNRPASQIHLTQIGDAVEFEALSRRQNEDFCRAFEASFRNKSLAESVVTPDASTT